MFWGAKVGSTWVKARCFTHFGPISGHSLLGVWKLFSKKDPEAALTQYKPRRSTNHRLTNRYIKEAIRREYHQSFARTGLRKEKERCHFRPFSACFPVFGTNQAGKKKKLRSTLVHAYVWQKSCPKAFFEL